MYKFSLIFLLLVFIGCGSEEQNVSEIKIDPGFSSYVNAFTSGVISNRESIKVVLFQSYENADPGQLIKEEIFDFEPKIDGQAYWLDQQTIEFRPDQKLQSGKQYTAEFSLNKLMEVPEEFNVLSFGFMVKYQSLFVKYSGMRSLDINDFSKQEIFGKIRTGDVVEPSELEMCFSATQKGEELNIVWEHSIETKVHTYTITNVSRSNKESFVKLSWNGEPIGVELKDEMEVRIPPLGEFSVLQASSLREPGLHFSIQFSDPIDPNQDIEGLVYLMSGKKIRLSIYQNEIKAYPTEKLNSEEVIVINKTILNAKGQQLQNEFQKKVQFNLEKPAIELIGKGVIMPSNGSLNFPFKAINLKSVNVRILRIYENNIAQFFQENQYNGSENLSRVGRLVYDDVIDLVSSKPIDYGIWNNFKIDLNKMIETEPGAIYRVLMSFEKYQSLYPCGDSVRVIKPMKRRDLNFDSHEYYFNADNWFEGWSSYRDRDNPCTDSYYKSHERRVSRNIFASNFGIVAKESADNAYDVVITDLRSTDPLKGVVIEAYNYQNQLMNSQTTNGDGFAHIDAKGKPYLIIAKQGNQRGYLRVDKGSALSLSLYEVGGNKIKQGVKGAIYGERGVWRPGDSLFLSFILEDKLKTIPDNHPIILELYDPLGKLFEQKVSTNGVEGLYAFRVKTQDNSPTGRWLAKVIVGNSEFTKTLKIETIKPNRIRIDLKFPDLISSGKSISSTLSANWLYGSPASGLKSRIEMKVLNMKTAFKNYEDYQFDDRSKSFSMYEPILSESKTSESGVAKINFDWKQPKNTPGMLKMRFSSKVFEEGGDFSQDFQSKKYSPYSSYVGIKLSGGSNWGNAFNTEESHALSFAAVTEEGKPISRQVKVELYEVSYNWWWEGNGEDELTRYVNRKSSDLVKTEYFNIVNGKSIYNLKFPNKGWGKYLIRIIDPISGHSAMEEFYADYPGWYSDMDGNTDAAAMLNLETDKKEYSVGETAEITVPSGGVGRFYVTIEKGDKVIKQFWVNAKEGSTKFSVQTSKDMAPNVYVSAVLIQPHGQEKNSLPIRMYGIIPLNVSDPLTHLNPVISTPKIIQPESTFNIKVKEKNGKKMAYTLAVVDEGLLSLTRYQTPNPWPIFYNKEALGVVTWDMYKYVMSAETGKMAALLAIGGDEGLVFKEDAKANRFKPVVKYLGPFYLENNEVQSHTVHIPNYIGAVRVMLVAAHEGAYGSTEQEIQVKKPLMVQTTLPRVLGPSEKVTIPVNVISMSNKIKNVKVKVTTNNLLIANGTVEQKVSFNEIGDQTIYFDFDVAKKLGVAKFKVEVSSGNEKAYEELEILVRPSNPIIDKSKFSLVEPGQTWSQDYQAFGIEGTNKAKLQVSKLPDLDLEKHLGYLIRYPHGCIEQTTSAVFPQLYLNAFVELSKDEKTEIDNNIIAALNKYKSFQNTKGGFAYWPTGNSEASEWGTNYAGHFMLEAKNRGYEIPAGMLKSWLKYQKKMASRWNRRYYSKWGRYNGDLSQAYRLYTLALASKPNIGAMNRLKNDTKLSNSAAWRLAAAYALIGRNETATELSKREYVVEYYRSMGYSYGSNLRDQAMILETMVYTKDIQRAAELIKEIAKTLNIGWHSTQSRAYALLAIGKFLGGSSADADQQIKYKLTLNANEKIIESNKPLCIEELNNKSVSSGSFSLNNLSEQPLFVSFVQTGVPTENTVETKEKKLRMNVVYQDLKGNNIDVSKLNQGQDFKAIVRVSHPGVRNPYKEMALSQIFPSGWQIVNTRLSDDYFAITKLDYQDFRDDRAYSYFSLNKGQTITIEVLLNATFLGKYYLPAIYCAPMYDESIFSVKAGQWVEVVK